MASEENSIRSAASVWASFILLLMLVTLSVYPGLALNATLDFFGWNTAFLNFVAATFEFSNALASAVPPIGAVGVSVQRALVAAAPNFRTAMEGITSFTSSLAALNPSEKYILTQSSATWTVAIVTLLAGQRVRARRRMR